jgi:TonB family protein
MEIQHVYLDNLEGAFEKFYPDGSLKAKGSYHLNTYDDTLKGYYPNGVLKRIDVYCKGDLIEGKSFGTDGQDTTYFPFYQQASYPGGEAEMNKYIAKNIKYPQDDIQGKCYLKFKVNPDGSISDVVVIRGIAGCPYCDKECIRVVKTMPNWIPFVDNEVFQEIFFSIPITFSMN